MLLLNYFGYKKNHNKLLEGVCELLQDIVNYFLFALNLIIFATVAFAGVAYLVTHLNDRAASHSSNSDRKNLPLYDILLDYHHRDVDHWFAWIKTQSIEKQEQALQMLVDYLSEPIDYKGLVTRDVLKVITNFPSEELFDFLDDFSKSALRNWHRNRAIASFYEQSLLSMMEADSQQASLSILSQLKESKADATKDVASRYMVSALSRLENLSELKYCFKEITMDDFYDVDFKIDSLDLLKLNDNHQLEVVSHVLNELIQGPKANFPLFNYCLSTIFESKELDSEPLQDLLIDCFLNPDLESESTQNLLNFLAVDDFYISQKLIFRILNSVSNKNYKFIKQALIERSKFSDSERTLIEDQELVKDNFDDLSNNSYDFKIFNFDEAIECDQFLREELGAMQSLLDVDSKPCLKIVYGNSRLEKLYTCKVLASLSSRSLLVLDLDNILDFATDAGKLDQVLSQDPNKIVFIKNLKNLIRNTDDGKKRKYAMKIFSLLRKHIKGSVCNFVACVEDKLENIMDDNVTYKNFCEENNDIIMHSYTFDLPGMARKKGIYKSIYQHLDSGRGFDLKSFDDLKETIENQSHFEFINFIYRFFHDSLLTYKRVLSIKKYNHLLQEKRVFDGKKPLLKLDYVS